ncbi:hormogonium polysaccharide secretion pseudopilin HpsC [Okeania sp. SIO1I7]|uniref:hormogonium polysaccharide secretion pseudopilin HpsC n=1 Tax=Okeania sp. SIO1I7 TaxID=2607772 RepID=UPI0013FAAEEC|nr:hormogonium polysaccharide secretion pseudopilin HpsC [Okeania sp. SIO1I7]NET29681.1 type II secretion system protein [Okeania sp. SIO1I7]
MKTLIRLLIKAHIKPDSSKSVNTDSGFTMIELLVGTIIAFLITIPLLSFVVDVLNTDVKEEAKANTEQEVQTALDYIEQDLSQALYIYDNDGIVTAGIGNQVSFTNRTPILVFWKRQFVPDVIPVPGDNSEPPDDTHVYSLIAYYLSTNNPNGIWSDQVRIERFELRDAVVNRWLDDDDDDYIIEAADPGFNDIPIGGTGTLEEQMNSWTKNGDFGGRNPEVLIDYVDQGTATGTVDCTNVSPDAQLIGTANSGFYACVDSSRTLAKVFIRGNGLARIQDNAPTCTANSTYCPTGSLTVQGRSLFGSQ